MMIYSLIIHLFIICYILCMFSGTNTIPKKETLHLYVFHIVIFYIMCMFIGTKPFFENTTITKNRTIVVTTSSCSISYLSYETCLINLIFSLVKGFYFILLNIFSYVYFREMGKNKWWFKSLILYFFTNCYLLCMFIGTKPFFGITNITKNKRTTIPAECLVWWISHNRAITLLNVAMDDLPLQVVRPA